MRVAERIATLDLVSDGRVDFGTGETSSQAELEGFGIERTEKREQWDEALDAVTRMFVESPFAGYEGRYITMPVREVLPKTLQKPHPPLWVACSRRDTIHLAATKGIGALTFSFVEPDEARMWVDDYYDTIASEACVPAGFAVNPNLAVVLPMMCHEDEQTAIDRGLDGGHFFGYSLGHWYVFGEHTLGRTSVYEQFEKNRDLFGFRRQTAAQTGQVLGAQLFERGIGSLRARWAPPTSSATSRAYEEVGVDQIIFVSQAGNNRHEHICESMELFAREVMPEFAERADEREKAKLERLAPAMEAALARREPARVAPDTVLKSVFLGS